MPTTCKFGKLISAERQCGLVECVGSQKDGSRAQTVTSLFDVTEPGGGIPVVASTFASCHILGKGLIVE
jgi:hypothetical protein